VQNESATGSTTTSRVRTTLTITVEKTDFDVQAGALHVAGPVSEENKYVKMGQYHTLDLEIQRNVTIIKDEWDSVALDRVKEACDVSKKAEVGAVVLQEGISMEMINSRFSECMFVNRTYDYSTTKN
jgi:protein pelota